MSNEVFNTLNNLNVNDRTEKKQGLTYLSWAWAWQELKKKYPEATYNIHKFGENQKPYLLDEDLGYMVFTDVTIEGITHEMWLPVLDGANKAMKNKPYTYEVNDYQWNKATKRKEVVGKVQKDVDQATMFNINTSIMRCLVKNLAMHGLGIYIYAGEDIPSEEKDELTRPKLATVEQVEAINDLMDSKRINAMLEVYKVSKVEEIEESQAKIIITKLIKQQEKEEVKGINEVV